MKNQEQIDLWLDDALDALSQVEQWPESARSIDTCFGDHPIQDKSIDADLPRILGIKRELYPFLQDRAARKSEKYRL